MGDLTPEEQRIAGVTLAYLTRCVSEGEALYTEILTRPTVGSTAATLLRDKDLLEPLYVAAMFLHASRDHYLTLQSMFIQGQVPPGAPVPVLRNYSPYTVVRAALEGDAWACWLLEPKATPAERVGRGLTVRAMSIRDARRLGLKVDNGEPFDHAARFAQIAEVAGRHNLEVKRTNDEHKDILWVGVARPDVSRLLSELLPEKSADTNDQPLGWHTYSLLSGRAHGSPWAALFRAKRGPRLGPHAGIAEIVIDLVELMRLVSISLRVHSEAIRRAAVLDSRDPKEWKGRRGPTAEERLAVRG